MICLFPRQKKIPGAPCRDRPFRSSQMRLLCRHVNLRNISDRHEARKQFMSLNSDEEVRAKLRELLGIHEIPGEIITGCVATQEFPGYTMQKLIIRKDGEVPLPCPAVPSG